MSTQKQSKEDEKGSHLVATRPQENPKRPRSTSKPPMSTPKRPSEGRRASNNQPQTTRRKKNRTKTIPAPSWTRKGPKHSTRTHPPGFISATKTVPRRSRTRSPNESNTEQAKRSDQDDPEAVLDRSWSFWCATSGETALKTNGKHIVLLTTTLSNRGWFEDGLGTNMGATKGSKWLKRHSKTEPQWSTTRPKSDIEFNIDFDLNPRGPLHEVTLVVWVGMAPRGGAPGAPGAALPSL